MPHADDQPRTADRASGHSSAPPAATTDTDGTSTTAQPAPAGERYALGEQIARGGMGVVYRATDAVLGREIAVKVLQDRYAPDSGMARRFADEARIASQLQHPGIPPVHDLGTLRDGRPFLAMKLIMGDTLEHLLERRPDPSADRRLFLAVFEQVCQAIAYAHAHHVIHRDLEPSNVMVGAFGEVQVMDWGLARVLGARPAATAKPDSTGPGTQVRPLRDAEVMLTQAGTVLGTPAFMPPEQALGALNKVDARSDVFGLGGILAVILTGAPPFQADSAETTRLRAAQGKVDECFARLDECGAEPDLVALCKQCLAPDPAGRPADAGAVARAVAGLRAAADERARQAELDRVKVAAELQMAEQRKRRRVQAALGMSFIALVVLSGAFAWWAERRAGERAKDRAVAAERNWQEAVSALAQAEEALVAGDLSVADVALTQAEGRIGEAGPAELRSRLAAARRDRDLVRDLRDIDDMSWADQASAPDQADVAARCQAAFARYGLDVGGADPGAAADAVRASRVSAALVAGLSEWFARDPNRPDLRQLLDRLDPDPDRVAVRAAIGAADEGRVRALVAALDGSKVPAWFAASVGYHRMVPPEAGVRLMAAAWRAHPADYLLAYRIGLRLFELRRDRAAEILPWARVAVAVRPDSPFSHNLLGLAWKSVGNHAEAEASLRRAVELGGRYPKYAVAHVNLGNVLADKGDLDGAEASYRAAIAIDPDTAGTWFHLGLLRARRGDLAEAEEWLRKVVASVPTRPYFRTVLDDIVRKRALLLRLDQVAGGRANPATAAEAIALASLASEPARRRYALAARLYARAFAADPDLADELENGHRQAAAHAAVLAAAGKDQEMTAFAVEEWGHLTGLAQRWLRADLAQLASRAKDRMQWPEVRARLTRWKTDADLASVRAPEWLAVMPPADRQEWESLWAEVDAVLDHPEPGPPAKP
jgi:tetratricopeptide (TPR) repeat protein